MFIVVSGGSGCGKSAYAEQCVLDFGPAKRYYIATMYPFDEESHERIKRHRAMRAEKNFETVECFTGLKSVTLEHDSVVLLECMSNLCANEIYQESGAGIDTVEEIMTGIRHLLPQVRHLVVVTNEIFSDGMDYDVETVTYQHYLGSINQEMGRMADRVVEVVYGIPLSVKG